MIEEDGSTFCVNILRLGQIEYYLLITTCRLLRCICTSWTPKTLHDNIYFCRTIAPIATTLAPIHCLGKCHAYCVILISWLPILQIAIYQTLSWETHFRIVNLFLWTRGWVDQPFTVLLVCWWDIAGRNNCSIREYSTQFFIICQLTFSRSNILSHRSLYFSIISIPSCNSCNIVTNC